MQLRGATVLLTGATGGIGGAIAHELVARGAVPVLTGRKADVLEALAAGMPGDVRVVAAPLASASDAAELAAEVGPVDVLIANAGVEATAPVEEQSAEEIDRIVGVNLVAPTALLAAYSPAWLARRRGHAVLISSVSGMVINVGNGPLYAATKWGLRGLVLSVREDWRGSGVGISGVYPGPVADAGMFARAGVAIPRGLKPVSPHAVARAACDAVERERAETVVADPLSRLGARIGGLTPGFVAAIARAGGAQKVRDEMRRIERGGAGG